MQNSPLVSCDDQKIIKKRKLIVLSDLWGKSKSDWFAEYETLLKGQFDIVFYDCRELAELDLSYFPEEQIHHQFTNGGIEKAVKSLLEKEQERVDVLGFSIGGLIAWKTVFEGLKVENLFALSSTRLRYEKQHPNCKVNLFYAENDTYKPNEEWFTELQIEMNIYEEQDHYFYSDKEIVIEVCKIIIDQANPKRK